MSIESFDDNLAEEFFYSGELPSKGCGWKPVADKARRSLDMLHAATSPQDLWYPPGNNLKKLRGDRKEMYSIRINQKWRVVFRWTEEGPMDVRIEDYH